MSWDEVHHFMTDMAKLASEASKSFFEKEEEQRS